MANQMTDARHHLSKQADTCNYLARLAKCRHMFIIYANDDAARNGG